jgi:hypothetical protein
MMVMQNTWFRTTGLVCLVVVASLFTGCMSSGGNNPPMATYQTPQPAVANPPGTGANPPLLSSEQCDLLKKQMMSASYAENNAPQKFIDSTIIPLASFGLNSPSRMKAMREQNEQQRQLTYKQMCGTGTGATNEPVSPATVPDTPQR